MLSHHLAALILSLWIGKDAMLPAPVDVPPQVESVLSQEEIEGLLDRDGVVGYAYMDYSSASEAMKPIIRTARKRIIHTVNGWSVDGIDSYVIRADPDITLETYASGEGYQVEYRIPQFSELFPTEWYASNYEEDEH